MTSAYSEGDKVEWDWSGSTATGTVRRKYTQKRTLKMKGSEITRDASEDCPAYRIEQEDGDEVFKSHSELRRV